VSHRFQQPKELNTEDEDIFHPSEEEEEEPQVEGEDLEEEGVEPRKWMKIVNVQNFRPEELKVILDTEERTVKILTKRNNNKKLRCGQETRVKLIREISVPMSVHMRNLIVVITPRGLLVLKAPYKTSFQSQQWEETTRKPFGLINIPIEQLNTPFTSTTGVYGKQRRCHHRQTLPRQFTPFEVNKCGIEEYLRIVKKAFYPKHVIPRCVIDEKTGKPILIIDIKVNTTTPFKTTMPGINQEEVKVFVQEKKHLLIVKLPQQPQMEEEDEEECMCNTQMKPLTKVVVLPKWLAIERLRFRVLNNGILRIQVPLLRVPHTTSKFNEEEEMEDFQGLQGLKGFQGLYGRYFI